MKKTILGILLIVTCAILMAGCSLTYDGQDVDQKETQEQTQQETTTEEKDGCLDDGLFY